MIWAGAVMIWAGAVMIWAEAVMIWTGACSNANFPTLKLPKNAKKQSVTDGPTDGQTGTVTKTLKIHHIPLQLQNSIHSKWGSW